MKHHIIAFASALILLSACSETDIDLFSSPLSEMGSGTLKSTKATVNSLDFSWEPVEGVHQYGYTLFDTRDKAVRQGITRESSISFSNLEAGYTYRFEIEAFGANGKPTLKYTINANTDPIIQLPTPELDKLQITIDNGRFTLSWPAVEGADYYMYDLLNPEGESLIDGTLYTPSVTFNTLPIGTYVFEVTAYSDYEGYTTSETASTTFKRERLVKTTYTGTYVSGALGTSRTCTMDLYDDGAYSIRGFYGMDSYDLEFSISSDKVISILNYYYENGNYKYVETGLGDNTDLIIYQDPSYCTYSVLPTGKRIKLYVYFGDSSTGVYDTFTWK